MKKPPQKTGGFLNAKRKPMKILDLPTKQAMESEPPTIDIINPEVPTSGAEKLALLNRCMAAIALGGRIEGVTPNHVSSDGMYMISRALKARARRHEV